jgi:dihydrofolate reductase
VQAVADLGDRLLDERRLHFLRLDRHPVPSPLAASKYEPVAELARGEHPVLHRHDPRRIHRRRAQLARLAVRGDREGDGGYAGFFAEVGAMAMGATTYEWVLDHDDLLTDPEPWRRSYGDTPCWVFTHRELPPVPGADLHFVEGDVRPVHEELTSAANGKNVWLVGGGDLVGQFADHGLLDEILVGIAPVTLGRGAPLLPRRLTASQLELVDLSRTGQFAHLTYRVRR